MHLFNNHIQLNITGISLGISIVALKIVLQNKQLLLQLLKMKPKTKQIQKPIKQKAKTGDSQQQKKQTKVQAGKDNKQHQRKKIKAMTIQQIIKKDKNFSLTENGKLKCNLTGHEMTASPQQYRKYLQSKSYKRGLQTQFDITEYEQVLVDHSQNPTKYLYCQLTEAKIPKKKSAIEKHVEGKKFKRLLDQYKKQQELEAKRQIELAEKAKIRAKMLKKGDVPEKDLKN